MSFQDVTSVSVDLPLDVFCVNYFATFKKYAPLIQTPEAEHSSPSISMVKNMWITPPLLYLYLHSVSTGVKGKNIPVTGHGGP
jgi:hypothetical protein